MRHLTSICAVLAMTALSGCKAFSGCEGPSNIGDRGTTVPPLRVPVGLAEPHTQEALQIPEVNEPEAPRPEGKCLDQPPSYFPDRRVGAESPKETQPNAKPQAAPEQPKEAPAAGAESGSEKSEKPDEKPPE